MSVKYRSSPYYTNVKFSEIKYLNSELRKIPNRKVFFIDDKVWDLYEPLLKNVISSNPMVKLKSSENDKSFEKFTQILANLSIWNINRNDSIVAIGGGVILDLVGFAASVFKRGCRLIFIPTTFVAMVDAAIGGKNGINQIKSDDDKHNMVCKNQIGTFYPANEVIICPQFLETLTEIDMLNGWAECIKISLLIPNKLYNSIMNCSKTVSKNIIRDAINFKEKLCRNDLYDRSTRRKLNLGHTFAHLIETASSFEVPHGIAVALGIRCAAAISLKQGRIDNHNYHKIIKSLDIFNFPKSIPSKYCLEISNRGTEILLRDKKTTHNIKIVVFAGFQNTRVISCNDPQEIVSTLINL